MTDAKIVLLFVASRSSQTLELSLAEEVTDTTFDRKDYVAILRVWPTIKVPSVDTPRTFQMNSDIR